MTKDAWKTIRRERMYEHRETGYRVALARSWCVLLPLPEGSPPDAPRASYRDERGIRPWFSDRWAAQRFVEDLIEELSEDPGELITLTRDNAGQLPA